MFPEMKFPEFSKKREEVKNTITDILDKNGKFQITGIMGLFEAKNPRFTT